MTTSSEHTRTPWQETNITSEIMAFFDLSSETWESLNSDARLAFYMAYNRESAAPDLLEALENLWAVCDANGYEIPMGYRNQVFTAFAKAKSNPVAPFN